MTGRAPVAPMYVAPPSYAPYAPGGYAPSAVPAAPYRGAPAAAPTLRANVPQVAAQAPRPNNGLIVRGQRPEDPIEPAAPAPRPREEVRLPSPEELGVGLGRPAEAGLDWASVHRRLEGLGAVCFQMRQLPQGGWHVTCLLPTAQADRTQRVEAKAEARAEAVRLALEQAEQWARTK
jgi:hypothetical protein